MYKTNDYIVYGKDVCKICDIEKKKFNNEDYYLLKPLKDLSLNISVPVSDKANKIRPIISEEEAEKIVNNISNIPQLEVNTKNLDETFKSLLELGKPEDLIKIIKTTYLRNKKHAGIETTNERNNIYFNLAEEYLYNEFSIALGFSFEETKRYIIDRVLNIKC